MSEKREKPNEQEDADERLTKNQCSKTKLP